MQLSLLYIPVIAVASVAGLISCTSAEDAPVRTAVLATPQVVMAADPQPPYTYWAPENSTSRNHPPQRIRNNQRGE